jgi:hypothetical protein
MDAMSLHAVLQAGRFTRIVANGRQAADANQCKRRGPLHGLWFCLLLADTIKYLCLTVIPQAPKCENLVMALLFPPSRSTPRQTKFLGQVRPEYC